MCTPEEGAELRGLLASAENADAIASFLCSRFATAAERLDVHAESANADFVLFSAYLVFMMQAGFAMLCAGSIRAKNAKNILLKNVLDSCVGAICYYTFGYAFAYGGGSGNKALSPGFIGNDEFGLFEFDQWAFFLFQWAFAAAAATIVSGSVAERTSLLSYLAYSALLTGFVYPVISHWVWSSAGWISAFNADNLFGGIGLIDFAGSGVVHMVGGFAGLCGAVTVGARIGRFDSEGKPNEMQGHSATLVVLGTFLLWFGWYGFNPGSMLIIIGNGEVVGRVAVVTTLAGASAGTVALFFNRAITGVWDLLAVCNGLLAGLVSITAGCAVITPWGGILVGAVGAVVFKLSSMLLLKLRIDDPLDAFPMHGCCGMWGVFVVGWMAREQFVMDAYGKSDNTNPHGVFYGGKFKLLGVQMLGIVVIIAWTVGLIAPLFFVLSKLGVLRVSEQDERVGMDVSKHGGSAYAMETLTLNRVGLQAPSNSQAAAGKPPVV
eukprot:jgi/Mesvir1/29440/Mv23021-RA.1